MRNNQLASHISILPDELLAHLFSYLNPRDLLNAEQVATLWRGISHEPAIWRNLINQYFPYLHQQKQSSPPVLPKELFIQEFQRVNESINRHPECASIKPYLFAGLSGDVGKIKQSDISDNAKEQLYIFAAANGHQKGLDELKNTDIAINKALRLAVKNGHFKAFQMIITQAKQHISAEYKGMSLEIAAKDGQLKIVQTLLNLIGEPISAAYKGQALQRAAEKGRLKIVQFLLTRAGQQIPDEYKGWASNAAAQNGHLSVAKALLTHTAGHLSVEESLMLYWRTHIGAIRKVSLERLRFLHRRVFTSPSLSAEHIDKGRALKWAAEKGHLEVVQVLSTHAGLQISAEDKGQALQRAAEKGRLKIVQFLLTRAGQQIPDEYKGWALRDAAEKGHLNVVQFLLTQISHPSSADESSALWHAARNGHLNVVQFLLIQAGQIFARFKGLILKHAAENGHQDVLSFLLKTWGHELSSLDVIKAIGVVRASQFYASRIATALGNIWASFAPTESTEQPTLPPVTIPLSERQSVLPPTTQEIPKLIVKRKKQGSTLENSSNEADNTENEDPRIKHVKFR